jgi:hypothetical protein
MSYAEYTEQDRSNILESVLTRLINGESMRKICLSDGMPDRVTLIRWVYDDPEYATTIARARELQAEGLLDDMTDVCDKIESGELDANSGKAIIWAKQWIAGRMNKKYGEKIQTEHSGEVSLNAMSDDALNARIAAILAGQTA